MRKLARTRHNGVISGWSSIDAHIVDAMGGGLCSKHGKYFGHGKHGLRDCPICDRELYYQSTCEEKIGGEKPRELTDEERSMGVDGPERFL